MDEPLGRIDRIEIETCSLLEGVTKVEGSQKNKEAPFEEKRAMPAQVTVASSSQGVVAVNPQE